MSLRKIANAVQLSVATVSRALRNDPAVANETATRIREAARDAGYQWNPHVGAMMSSLRRSQGHTFQGNLALIWVDLSPSHSGNREVLSIQAAARKRAAELGYSLDEFDLPRFRPEQLHRILKSRNVQGIFFSPSYNPHGKIRLKFPVDDFAVVGAGWAISLPPLSNVRLDQYQAMALAMHHARHGIGKGGIAALCDSSVLRRSSFVMRASFLLSHPAGPKIASSLFFESRHLDRATFSAALKRHKVQTLILQREFDGPAWIDQLVPASGRIYLEEPHQSTVCKGWIDRRYPLVGQWGIETLIGLIQRGEKGIPATPQTLLIPPQWIPGRAEM